MVQDSNLSYSPLEKNEIRLPKMLGHLFVTLDVTAHAVRYAISFTGAAIGLSLLFAFYTVCQFCFHPLARVPGPHLAAWTSLYKAYYIHFGDISGHTIILHQKYGNVVRIAPNELSFASIESTKVIYGMSVMIF